MKQKRIIFTEGGKGGVGKTTVLTAIVNTLDESGVKIKLLDFDNENSQHGSLLHYFSDRCDKININDRDGLDAFMDAAMSDEYDVVIADMGARSGDQTFKWFDDVYEDVKEFAKFTAVGVIIDDTPSVTSVVEWGIKLRDRVDYLVVLNEANVEDAGFDQWENSIAANKFKAAAKPTVVRFESINPDLQAHLLQSGGTLQDAVDKKINAPKGKDTRFSIRANSVLRSFKKELSKAKAILS